jgi:hypothetical protein
LLAPVQAAGTPPAVAELRQVAERYPDSALAIAADATIRIGKPKLILDTATLFGRHLDTNDKPQADRWPVGGKLADRPIGQGGGCDRFN